MKWTVTKYSFFLICHVYNDILILAQLGHSQCHELKVYETVPILFIENLKC